MFLLNFNIIVNLFDVLSSFNKKNSSLVKLSAKRKETMEKANVVFDCNKPIEKTGYENLI